MNADFPRSTLPVLIFSEDAVLCGERDVRTAMPEISDPSELRHVFIKSLGKKQREGFFRFCRARVRGLDCRLYRLASFGPFRAAFAEKTALFDTPVTVVFVAPSVTAFYRLMSPASAYASDTVSRVLFELFYLMDGGTPSFASLSPEIYTVVERVPLLAEALFSRRSGTRCCDIGKILASLLDSIGSAPFCRDCRFELRTDGAGPEDAEIFEIPVEAFVSVMTVLTALAVDLSADDRIAVALKKLGPVVEVVLTTATEALGPIRGEEGTDGLYLLPECFHARARFASALCLLTQMDLSLRCEGDEDAKTRMLSLSLLLGCEPPPILDFKYSDPVLAVPGIVEETLAFLPEGSGPPSREEQ